MDKTLLATLAAIVAIGIAFAGYFQFNRVPAGVGCTMEAKICPDGSTVGRTGPNCEFAACPGETSATTTESGGGIMPYNSGVRGAVVLGPTCPVERIPPDPQCAPKPYATTITVRYAGSTRTLATTASDATGTFGISLPPGAYTISAAGGQTLPRCADQNVTVQPNDYATVTIMCDTGIR